MKRLLLAGAVGAMALFSTAPFLWSVSTSLKPESEVTAIPPTLLPARPSVQSYRGVFEQRPFARYLLNSVGVAALATLLTLFAAAPAAYSLARLCPPGTAYWRAGILGFALLPPAVLLAPLYSLARGLGLLDSLAGLAAVHAALHLPFAVWMLEAAFRDLPVDLEDAARIDGFSRVGMLTRIVLPLSAPALGAAAILVFIFSWNEFVIALTFLSRDELRTVPVGIAMLTGATTYEVPWGQISAAVVLTTLPVVVAILAFQRWIVGGLTAGAVKG